jgi:hypothetical protein
MSTITFRRCKDLVKRISFLAATYRFIRQIWWFISNKNAKADLAEIRDAIIFYQNLEIQSKARNPLNRHGAKCFSQADEDGITLEILRRIDGIRDGVFAEYGVGDGSENNTLVLAALGWRGFWVGGQDLGFKLSFDAGARFTYIKDWIVRNNIVLLTRSGLEQIDAKNIDVISLDLDGNDIYFVNEILSGGFKPKLFISLLNTMQNFRRQYDSK